MWAEGFCETECIPTHSVGVPNTNGGCFKHLPKLIPEQTDCVCECDSELLPYISNCDSQTGTVTKDGNSWISYVSNTGNSSGYLIHLHCPFDYCIPSTSDHEIIINLNKLAGADAQCAYNRAGTLCGTCKPGFSLSFGSSRCILCSRWHIYFSVILLAAFLAGIVLVTLLLMLNLTVAVGTLNGIIFYANIMGANSNILFPFSSSNFVTVFVAWLNLDLGIDTCFFEGMDTYSRLWIELAFSAYLIILVVAIIFISEQFTKFAQLIGRKNPVAALATLILLSYAKLLRTVIASLSFAVLDYPDGSREIVWLSDGTVGYLRGKHVALFLAAVSILLVGVAYTTVLFFWQWLLRYQNKNIFKWVRNQRLCHFLEPYHAPYTFEHRYWTGLLLLARAALYIVAAINVSNDPGTNLLAIGCIMVGILVLKEYLKGNKIYKQWPLELIEMTCYLNITLFSLVSFYFLESGRDQTIIAYISVSITFALFVIVLLYHIVTEVLLKSRLWKRLRQRKSLAQVELSDNSNADNDQIALIAPTSTVIDAPPHGEQPLSALVEEGEVESNFKNESEDADSQVLIIKQHGVTI